MARRVGMLIVLVGAIAGLRGAEPAAPARRWPEIDPAQRKEEAFALKIAMMVAKKPATVRRFLEEELKRNPAPYVKGYAAWVEISGRAYGLGDKEDLVRGLALAREASEGGSVIGQETLGIAVGLGLGVAPDRFESVRLLQEAARRGSMRALAELGRFQLSGYGVRRDPEAGARDLERAAHLSGDVTQYWLMALAYETGKWELPKDLAKTVECYYNMSINSRVYVEKEMMRLAAAGAPNARLYWALSEVRDANEGIEVTRAKVREQVPILEELGGNLAAAQYELGTIYVSTKWVGHDFKKALEHLNRARGLGDDRANYTLAYMRLVGRGVPRDEAGALSDLQMLAADGDPHAAALLGAMYYWGSSDAPSLPKDARKAYEYARTAAENGSVTGMANIARCYEEGIGVTRDYLLAAKLYWIAYQRGALGADEKSIRLSHFIEEK